MLSHRKAKRPKNDRIDYSQLTFGKTLSRSIESRLAHQSEDVLKAAVRAECVQRDGHCRHPLREECEGGESEWAHAPWNTRAMSRGMPSAVRHTTADSFMACARHHKDIEQHRCNVIPKSKRRRANGRLAFYDKAGHLLGET